MNPQLTHMNPHRQEKHAKHIRSHIFGDYMKDKELQTPNGILLNENFLKIEMVILKFLTVANTSRFLNTLIQLDKVGAKNQHIFYKNYVDNGKIAEKEIEKLTVNQEETDESDKDTLPPP